MKRSAHLLTFFALTFVYSWLLWIPAALIGKDAMTLPVAPLYMFGGFGPSLVAIFMIRRTMSPTERKDYWRRLLNFRQISAIWYAVIVFAFPILFAAAALIHGLTGGEAPAYLGLKQVAAQPVSLIGVIILGLLTGPLAEELGWRGFALDRIQKRWSALVASLMLGLIWWAWHLPLFFIRGTLHHTWGLWSPGFWAFLVTVVPLTVLMTWVYNNNRGSILAAVLVHFFFNFSLSMIHPFPVRLLIIFAGLLVVVTAAIVFVWGPQNLRRTAASSGSIPAVQTR